MMFITSLVKRCKLVFSEVINKKRRRINIKSDEFKLLHKCENRLRKLTILILNSKSDFIKSFFLAQLEH